LRAESCEAQIETTSEYLKQAGLFDGFVAGCPLHLTSPNAPAKRDVLGTVMLSVLAGHRRYAHITALRGDGVNAPLLGMRKVVSEDAVRRALGKIPEDAGVAALSLGVLPGGKSWAGFCAVWQELAARIRETSATVRT